MTGHIAFETVTSFFSDFHHEDREDVDVEAVFLHPEEAVPQSQDPDAEDDSSIRLVSMFAMKADLSSPEMKQWQNEYLQGTGSEMYTESLSSSLPLQLISLCHLLSEIDIGIHRLLISLVLSKCVFLDTCRC